MNLIVKIKILVVAMFMTGSGTWLKAQNEFSKWIFGTAIGLDFSTNPPTQFNVSSNFGPSPVAATISDNSGNLLFYTNGIGVFDKTYAVMGNGSNIGAVSAMVVAKQPGNNNNYYIFTSGNNAWVRYSIVDMNLAAGMGSVTTLNTNIYLAGCNKLVTARHCNGKDVWLISHDYNSNQFRSYLLTNSGLSNTPVLSATGPTLNNPGAGSGALQVSPNGRLLAMAQASNSSPSTLGTAGFYLFDFDAATGIISNPFQITQANVSQVLEFSSDGKKLYGNTSASSSNTASVLYQWDLCAGNSQAIAASAYSINLGSYLAGDLRRAINGKIYMTYQPSGFAPSYSISVINTPTASGAAMNFVLGGQPTGTTMPNGGLPNYINPYVKPVISFTPNANCQHVSFTGPVAPTYTGGCSVNTYPINGYLWDFGDATSGAANTSTAASPMHSYSTTGTYSVKLIVYSNCTNDTIIQTVNVSNLMPSISVSGNSVICKGENRTYTATGASTYSWSGAASTTSVASLSPASTTVYTVTGFANGCSTTNTFSVKVNDCQGLSEVAKDKVVAMYPNPFGNSLNVDMEEAMPYSIYSLDGKLVLKGLLLKGHNELNTESLKPGLYIAECGKGENSVRFRVVKAE